MLSRLLKWDRATTGCFLLLIALGNTSFLGLPIVQAFFGDTGIPFALLYDQLGSFLALAIYGSFILAVYGRQGGKQNPASIVKKIFMFPPFIALILAFLLRGITYPAVVLIL